MFFPSFGGLIACAAGEICGMRMKQTLYTIHRINIIDAGGSWAAGKTRGISQGFLVRRRLFCAYQTYIVDAGGARAASRPLRDSPRTTLAKNFRPTSRGVRH